MVHPAYEALDVDLDDAVLVFAAPALLPAAPSSLHVADGGRVQWPFFVGR
jgi:hypothetical protein